MVDLTAEILRECGAMAVAIYYIAVSNEQRGNANTYAMLAAQAGVSPKTATRVCQSLEVAGYGELTLSRGGRGKQSTFTPINCDTGVPVLSKTPTETPTETRTTPPHTPPLVNVNPPSQFSQRETGVNSPPTPSRRKTPAKDLTFPPPMLAFWQAYDSTGRERSSRQQVLGAWNQLHPDPDTIAAIMEGVAAWTKSEKWQDGYAPGAHLFLHRRLWEERPAPPKTRTSPPPSRNGTSQGAFAEARALLNRRATPKEPTDVFETRGTVR